jgi:predicted phage terminase large subunit-like protein
MVVQRMPLGPNLREIENEQARRKLLKFIKRMQPEYHSGLPHKVIADKLDAFRRKEIKRLIIQMPPQHGKSHLSSRFFPAHILGNAPDTRVAIASYSDDLAAGFNRAVQRIIDTDEYRELFPNTYLNGYRPQWGGILKGYLRNSSVFEIVGRTGSLRTVGINTPLTGQPVDIGIIDDAFKDRATAESQAIRDSVWEWYTDVFLSRLHNESQQLLLMTRWHEDDLIGRLLTADEERRQQGLEPLWEVISFPAIKEDDAVTPYPNPLDTRATGEALWPERQGLELLAEKRSAGGERSWQSLYQQRPTAATGNIIKIDRFGSISLTEFLKLTANEYVTWNFKVDGGLKGDEGSDAHALYCSYFRESTNMLYIREVVSVRLEFPALLRYAQDFFKRNGYGAYSRIKIEPKANGYPMIQSFKEATALNVEAYKFPRVEGTRMDDKDKIARVWAVTPKIDAGRVVLIEGAWNQTFKKQTGAFPAAKNDDEVDCLSMDLLECFYGPKKPRVTTQN